ncbi:MULTISPECIES: helix-turn-helix domain-containing protein [Rhizobium]|uniref:helix-turn-helix domain-containing protein n=1 Tax=Rhizobium TaxID=379 RepID=UPI0003FF24D4|nr:MULTISPECIES: helix-turn-helix transcriptional regulator [Rhizobium]MCA0802795.1 helix-turn-helix domain-containing protein [Rhizobium sp. T1473]MCS0462650.1 helix-turn-helix domain-containing protein [Rhizobium favelukesii]UFS83635.1 helix-turn-helix domain-containing protein [Rhizobium sp. T136]
MPSIDRQRRNSEIDREIGERLRQLRQMRGMTQTTLGKAVNVTFQQMQKYERGFNRIAAFLQIHELSGRDNG